MSLHKDIKFPPLIPSQKQCLLSCTVRTSEEGHEKDSVGAICGTRKLNWTESSYIYASSGRKPHLLLQMESYVNKELQAISPHETQFQELKLQVYRNVFGSFISAFKTYQPLLSDIKKEYENTLVHQQDYIRGLELQQSSLRLVTEECDRKIQACRGEEQAVISALKMEKQQLQKDMREREKTMQAVVDHLQSELSKQYLQSREERDARKLLIWQLNDLTRGSVKEHPADEVADSKDLVELQLALRVCREDLTKTQEELTSMKAEYWDVVPRRDWDALEQTYQHTHQHIKTLQGDFEQLKSEYATLLELHKKDIVQAKTQVSTAVQTNDDIFSQGQIPIQCNQLEEQINSDVPESRIVIVQEPRWEPLSMVEDECKADGSGDTTSTQRLQSARHSSMSFT
ncbi:translin-associated factor X-interacting protein 1 isoform X2 [Parambassis ranga]|uniref:Translin-associated factor X-interacting protein 1 isoform X2 n=1 Tax=Parambassis ranga TaxID=210632 RepID=A0A6P7IH68_9TELE|nr:translin-associated factor X-interacting protein 1 isoform X2 [Parambassis ranga]